jgi:hypothetical protein
MPERVSPCDRRRGDEHSAAVRTTMRVLAPQGTQESAMRTLTLALLASLTLGPLAGASLGPAALAEEPPIAQPPAAGAGGFLQAPEAMESPVTGEAVEPDITIREEGQQLITEYRVNGLLYMVRIQPQVGPPYYLLDTDGDGTMDVRESAPRDNAVPQWVLFRWN